MVAAVLGALVVGPLTLAMLDRGLFALTGWEAIRPHNVAQRDPITPAGLAYLNLSLASWILVALAVTALVHRVRPGLLVSVVGRIRWRWALVSLGWAVVALVATVIVEAVIPATTTGPEPAWHHWTSQMVAFALVVAVTTPLQAIGEEFLFRGYLTQAVGGLVPAGQAALPRIVPVVVPALAFALAHGSQGLPVFLDRLFFGLLAGILVVETGGLEAGIVMHVLNNLLAFGVAIATGDVTTTLEADHGTWWLIPVTLTQTGVFLTLVLLARRRRGPDFATAPASL